MYVTQMWEKMESKNDEDGDEDSCDSSVMASA